MVKVVHSNDQGWYIFSQSKKGLSWLSRWVKFQFYACQSSLWWERCFAHMLMKVCIHQNCTLFAFPVEWKSFTFLIMQTFAEGNNNFDGRHSGHAFVSGRSLLINIRVQGTLSFLRSYIHNARCLHLIRACWSRSANSRSILDTNTSVKRLIKYNAAIEGLKYVEQKRGKPLDC